MKINRKTTDELLVIYMEIVKHITTLDIFWLEDIRRLMGCDDSKVENNTNNIQITTMMSLLKKRGYIQCCEVKGGNRQYMIVKPIILNEKGIPV
jgi:hypothetical protein